MLAKQTVLQLHPQKMFGDDVFPGYPRQSLNPWSSCLSLWLDIWLLFSLNQSWNVSSCSPSLSCLPRLFLPRSLEKNSSICSGVCWATSSGCKQCQSHWLYGWLMVHLCSPEAHSSFGSQDPNLSAVSHSQDYASSVSADGGSPLPSFLTSGPSVLTPGASSFVYNPPLLWNSDSVSKCAKLPVSDSFQPCCLQP